MTLELEIPDALAAGLGDQPAVAARTVLEGFAVEAYREGRFSAFEVRQLLGHDSRWETEGFLAAHGAWPGTTVEELETGMSHLDALIPAPPQG